jgi:hypothetical protein
MSIHIDSQVSRLLDIAEALLRLFSGRGIIETALNMSVLFADRGISRTSLLEAADLMISVRFSGSHHHYLALTHSTSAENVWDSVRQRIADIYQLCASKSNT